MRLSHLLAPAVVLNTVAAVIAPRRLRRLAQVGLVLYAATDLVAGARARHDAQHASDAALVPAVLGVMHYAHGLGQLRGWVRYGPPLGAFASVLRIDGLRPDSGTEEPVYAPSLRG